MEGEKMLEIRKIADKMRMKRHTAHSQHDAYRLRCYFLVYI